MTPEQPSAEGSSQDESPTDKSLDFLSPQFNPLHALQASPSDVHLPCPAAQPCDNLQMYLSVMKGTRRECRGGRGGGGGGRGRGGGGGGRGGGRGRGEGEGGRGVGGGGGRKEVKESAVGTKYKPMLRKQKTVVWFMHTPLSGPISLLQHCYSNRGRVRVWVRHCAGVRGVCEGVVLAFDRHFNLVLGEVWEEYSPFRTAANGGKESRKRRNVGSETIADPKLSSGAKPLEGKNGTDHNTPREKLTRHVKQLFIRGDNVVMVAPWHQQTSSTSLVKMQPL